MTPRASRGRRGARRASFAGALLAAGAFAPARAAAQEISTTLDVGGARVRYADTVNTTAAVVAPEVRLVSRHTVLGAAGMLSQSGGGEWTTQGTLGAALTFPVRGAISAEAGATAGGSTRHDGVRTGQATATLRAFLTRGATGVWLGGGGGGAWDGFVHRSVAQGEAGAWVSHGRAAATVWVIPTRVDDSLTYADAQLSLTWSAGVLRLDAHAGARAGARAGGGSISLDSAARQWGSLDATVQLRDRVAVVASAGTYPVDLTQGYPGGRYATLGVRLALTHSGSNADAGGAARNSATPRRATDLAFRSSSGPAGRTTLSVYAPGATAVAVTGDFTDWKPVACRPQGDGWWRVTLAIARGAHQMNVRLNDGAWRVPPGLTPVSDEFGGTVGVLDIP